MLFLYDFNSYKCELIKVYYLIFISFFQKSIQGEGGSELQLQIHKNFAYSRTTDIQVPSFAWINLTELVLTSTLEQVKMLINDFASVFFLHF
jgi:hypothetical protein